MLSNLDVPFNMLEEEAASRAGSTIGQEKTIGDEEIDQKPELSTADGPGIAKLASDMSAVKREKEQVIPKLQEIEGSRQDTPATMKIDQIDTPVSQNGDQPSQEDIKPVANGHIHTNGDENGHEDDAGSAESEGDDEEEGGESEEETELAYEAQRLETIRKNNALLASLGLGTITNPLEPSRSSSSTPTPSKPSTSTSPLPKRQFKTKPALIEEPRRSSRVAALQDVKSAAESSGLESLPQDWRDDRIGKMRGLVLPKGEKISVPSVRHYTDSPSDRPFKRRKVTPGAPLGDGELNGVEQDDFEIVAPRPTRMSDGTGRLVFGGRWKGVFEPNVTPEEMFVGGAFGGTFYADNYSQVLHEHLKGEADIQELPPTMRRAHRPSPSSSSTSPSSKPPFSPSTHLTSQTKDSSINRFGKSAGQTLQEWEKSGWIWKGDPRGWAQWYVRFWQGRRCVDDERQVHRWLNLAGPNGRFSRMLLKKIANERGSGGLSASNTAVEDEDVGTVMRQVCWQWGYQVNEAEWRRKVAGGEVRA